ncbi:MAG TPA: cache domain-containing protein, partial [Candidatus Binatia bacterium]
MKRWKLWPRGLFGKVAPTTIKGKLRFWFLFLSLAPIAVIGALAYTSSRASLEKEIQNKLDAVADNKSYILALWFKSQLADAAALTANDAIKDLLSPGFRVVYPNLAAKTDADRFQKVKDIVTARQETNSFYVDVLVADGDGKIVVSSSKSLLQQGKSLGDIGLAPKADNEAFYVSPVFFSQAAQQHVMMIVSPVHDNNANVVGRVILEVEFRPVYRLIDERSGLGQTGEVVLIDREHRMLTQSYFSEAPTILKTVPDNDPIRRGLAGEKGHNVGKDYRGVPVVGSFRPLPEIGAVLIAKIDESEVFAPIKRLRNLVLMIIAATIVGAALASLLLARTISRPIREGVGFAQQVAQGDLTVSLPAGDSSEIGQLS